MTALSEIPTKSWLSPKVELKDTAEYGKGTFAKELINREEIIVVYGGRNNYVSTAAEAEKAKEQGKLVIQWDDDLYSIEDRGEDIGYFINHSCDSNLWMKDAFTLIAKRDINKGEEITADYSLWEGDTYISKWKCKCGSPFCRKRITGNDWKIPEVQERYRGHFSPLINKKIAAIL